MEPGSLTVLLIITLLMISAFFSAAETALTSMPRLKLRSMAEDGVKGAGLLEKLLGGDKYLTTILIGNNFVNILLTSITTTMANEITGGGGGTLVLTTVLVTLVLLVFGEITPKKLGARFSEQVSLFVVKPISALSYVLTPLTLFFNSFSRFVVKRVNAPEPPSITESELKSIVDVSHEEGVLDNREQELIHNVFSFGSSDAEAIMTPRTSIAALPDDASYDDALNIFRSEGFSRVPVYVNDIDHIIGVLHFKDFFLDADRESFKPSNHIREPFFSYEKKDALDLLTEMRQLNASLAVILDEYGGTAGLVSLEDLIELLVGEIYDEYDETEEEIVVLGNNSYRVDGGARLGDFNQRAGTCLSSDDYETVGGYVMGLLDNIPEDGMEAEENGIRFTVEKASKNRIDKVLIEVTEEE